MILQSFRIGLVECSCFFPAKYFKESVVLIRHISYITKMWTSARACGWPDGGLHYHLPPWLFITRNGPADVALDMRDGTCKAWPGSFVPKFVGRFIGKFSVQKCEKCFEDFLARYLLRVFVTGADGFVGRSLCAELHRAGIQALPLPRLPLAAYQMDPMVSGLSLSTVVHLAARVHRMNDNAADPLSAFRQSNVDLTLQLANQAAVAGVRRFVFVSSVKVHGEATLAGHPFVESDMPAPQDAYAISKWEAEQGLLQISASTGMEVVIIRPPLVYGPGVKANFAALMRAVEHGLPLPLGAVKNLRSLVGLDNLVNFIITCTHHPAAANQKFLVSDGADISTPDLIRAIAHVVGRPERLISVPLGALIFVSSLIGKRTAIDRLCGNLQLDISKARKILQWQPPYSLEVGLQRVFGGGTK